jgi:hypothetical protein
MNFKFNLVPAILAVALFGAAGVARAEEKIPPPPPQDAPSLDKPVTPPDSYRIVMENDRVRMIEVHIKPHSKVDVESPPNRERFLYMLSDGALILAPPGKTPYEFALHAGETAVFPAVSSVVENDTDSAVRALMVEVKEPMRASVASRGAKGKRAAGRHTRVGKIKGRSRSARSAKTTRSKARHAMRSRATPSAAKAARPPLNLGRANAKPARKVTGKNRGSDG